MASIRDEQTDALSALDTAKALVEKVLSLLSLVDAPSPSFTFATNPIGFLVQMLRRVGVSEEQIRDWIVKFTIIAAPTLEIAIKAILLSKLKGMVSCSVDPRIPDKYRKRHKAPSDNTTSQEYGIDINIESIDYLDKLSVSPLSEFAENKYFGVKGVTDVYKFARAEDFDAFLWFVIHKGKFPNSSKVSGNDWFTDKINGLGADKVEPSGSTLLGPLTLTFNEGNPSRVLPGNTFTYAGTAHIISMCIDSSRDDKNNIVSNTLVPVSDGWTSVNWYSDSMRPIAVAKRALKKGESNKGRDYSKEKAICNLQYIDASNAGDEPMNGLASRKFRFTILPKPFIHWPQKGAPGLPKKMLFNEYGVYDKKGRYTIPADSSDDHGKITVGSGLDQCVITVDQKTRKVTVDNSENLTKNLIECYRGLTVYEFNYDYIMGIRLFDAKVLAASLLESLCRVTMGISVSSSSSDGADEIREIIKNIIESDGSTTSDCFYSFDKSKYENQMRMTEETRAGYSRVTGILSDFDGGATLNEQYDVINGALSTAADVVSKASGGDDRVKLSFATGLIEQLAQAIVVAVFSPKVLMLFEVNETLMGGTWEKIGFKDIMKAMRDIIVSIVREIVDMIVAELIKFLLELLAPLIALITSALLKEQLDNYVALINDILNNCPRIGIPWVRNKFSDTVLDTVDYADIDTTSANKGDSPEINNC